MNNLLNNFLIFFMTFIGTLSTVRFFLKVMCIIPENWKIYKWLHQDYDINVVSRSLMHLGFTKNESSACIEKIKIAGRKVKSQICYSKKNQLLHLIALLSKYTFKFDKEILYGKNTLSKSKFYINTMEASHNNNDLKMMSNLITDLIDDAIKKTPDFIVTPKSGNPFLCNAVSEHYGNSDKGFCLLKKQNDERSSARISLKEDPINFFRTNFEGSNRLLSHIQENKTKQAGLVLDCNISGGSQVLTIVSEINEIIQSTSIALNLVNNVFVLFRADTDQSNIDVLFQDKGCTLHRYFDLDEKLKEKLYNLKIDENGQEKEINLALDNDRKKIIMFINDLQSENKLKVKVNSELKKELQSS